MVSSIDENELHQSVLESTFHGIMCFQAIRDEGNRIIDLEWIFINHVAEQLVDKKKNDLIGKHLLDEMPGNKDSGLFERYKNVIDSGVPKVFEHHYVHDGYDQWFKISAVKLLDGLTVTFQDMSEEKSLLKRLEKDKEKYQKLFNESIDAILLVDDEYRIREVSPSFISIFGYPSEELVCMSFEDIVSDKDKFVTLQKVVFDQRLLEDYDLVLLDRRGIKKSCVLNITTLYDDDDSTLNFYLCVIKDLTKRKKQEKELLKAEKLTMSGKITRTIAHEVRNPLTNMSLALEQLQDEIPENGEAQAYLEIINRNAKRISSLISEMLNSSKPKELQLEKQNLITVVKEAMKLVNDRLMLNNMKLSENYQEDLPNINLDAEQIKVVLLNLSINAIEAMEPGNGLLSLSIRKNDGYVEILITDNGKGIPEDEIDNLFEPFFTMKKEGTGFGLTTVQNIIHAHQGRIDAESKVGEGTTFYVSLPIDN
ncbi:MAG TPA: ATP-binding protein [Cyclobacteriaceae bacterium]